ncbi:MAG: nitroreductase family deazaflavin-dependent oxidoreductase [Thermomicrobiales bacterium]|nr:nitroreductase family deazaflavin-dependent oxidoreductase [Thermomicrobiales bacterium]
MADRNDFNQQVIAEFRANGGKVGGMFEGAPMLLLTSTGAKSGQPRVAPLVYTTDGDRIVIIASKGGAPTNPDWYHNVAANPEVTVEIGAESFPARAEIAAEPERTRLFDAQAELMPGFRDYQNNTTRIIPVVTLSRA